MIACDSYLSLFFFTLQKKLRSGAIVRFSDNSSFGSKHRLWVHVRTTWLKNFDIFLIFAQNIYCGYTIDSGTQSMVWSKNKKTGVCRGIPFFLYFAHNIDCGYTLEVPQHRLWVHVRTASPGRL